MIIDKAEPVKARVVPVYDSSALKIPLVYEFKELIRYRFLLWNLIVKDLKVRYKRSPIGFLWVMLNPLLMMLVLTIVFSQVFRFDIQHYPIYLLAGTLMWNLYSQSTVAAMSSLQGNGPILRKLYVPPSVFVSSAIGSAVVNLLFALVPFLALALITGIPPSFTWLFLIVPVFFTTCFCLGVGLIVSALATFFSDIYEIYQVLLTAFYFLTPIFYPADKLPATLQQIEGYNPMYVLIAIFRAPVLDGSLPSVHFLIKAAVFPIIVLLIGWFFFTRVEGKFVYYF